MHIVYQGKKVELPDGSNGFAALKLLEPDIKNKALAYFVGEEVFDLGRPLNEDEEIRFVTGEDKEGFEILNHSCSHLMAQALKHLYPGVLFGFGPAIEEGFYYDIDFEEQIGEEDLRKIEKKMHELSSKDERIVREVLSKKDALERF